MSTNSKEKFINVQKLEENYIPRPSPSSSENMILS